MLLSCCSVESKSKETDLAGLISDSMMISSERHEISSSSSIVVAADSSSGPEHLLTADISLVEILENESHDGLFNDRCCRIVRRFMVVVCVVQNDWS